MRGSRVAVGMLCVAVLGLSGGAAHASSGPEVATVADGYEIGSRPGAFNFVIERESSTTLVSVSAACTETATATKPANISQTMTSTIVGTRGSGCTGTASVNGRFNKKLSIGWSGPAKQGSIAVPAGKTASFYLRLPCTNTKSTLWIANATLGGVSSDSGSVSANCGT